MFCFYVCLCTTCGAWCPGSSEEESGSPKIRIMGGCEPPCAYWEYNLGPPKEKNVLLTTHRDVSSALPPQTSVAENQPVPRTSLF